MYIFKIAQVINENVRIAFLYVLSIRFCYIVMSYHYFVIPLFYVFKVNIPSSGLDSEQLTFLTDSSNHVRFKVLSNY